MYKIISAEKIGLTKKELNEKYEGDITLYFDSEGGNASWMQYQEGYIVIDCGTGIVFFVEVL